MKIGLRELVLIACLVSMPLAAWYFAFRPRGEQVEVLKQEIQTKKLKLRQLNQMRATIGDLEEEITALKNAISFFQSKLPSEKEMDKVLQETWELAEANHLKTRSIRTLSRHRDAKFTVSAGAHSEQPIAVLLEGDFLGFYSFLQALEAQPRILRLQKLELFKLSGKETPEGRIRAKLELSVFFETESGGGS